MKAARVQNAPAGSSPYSATNPASGSAIQIQQDVPMPQPSKPGELLIRVKASTVIRDNLTWPEIYEEAPAFLGNDFSGTVVSVQDPEQQSLQPGDEVYGMTAASRGGTWAEYVVATSEEVYTKPTSLSWEEAAALPLSALTADQALFDHAKLELDTSKDKKHILITGASGAVAMFIVQFALAAGHHVVAASSSNARNEEYLRSLGATEIIEYPQLDEATDRFDAIIDTVGGNVLRQCWKAVKPHGALVSIDSSSYDFVNEHKQDGLIDGKENVHALFFVVKPSRESMERISDAVSKGTIKGVVFKAMPFEQASAAYELAHTRGIGRGKVVLVL